MSTRPKKELGQHFLADENILGVIGRLAALAPHDVVLEIGAGMGVLTSYLADRVARGADDLERDLLRGNAARRQAIAHLLRLGERQRATARTDDERGRSGRGRCCGLHPMTSRC